MNDSKLNSNNNKNIKGENSNIHIEKVNIENKNITINFSILLYIILIIVIILLIGFASGSKTENKEQSNINNSIMNETKQIVMLKTSLGNIEVELYADKAPKTVENFLKLAKDGFYDNTKFHRVIKDFMVQGGDPYTKGEDTSVYGTGGPGYKFNDEINPKSLGLTDSAIKELEAEGYSYNFSLQSVPLVKGTIAMANGGPNTNGSQFFIITAPDTSWLIGRHTGFGKVISGMEVVEKINTVETSGDPYNRPITPVIINKIIIK